MTTKYTYTEFIRFNHPDLSGINLQISAFFHSLEISNGNTHLSKEVKNSYPNKFNHHFHKKLIRPTKIKSSDPEILKRIRAILGKVSPSTVDSMYEQVVELLETHPHNWESVSELFFNNIIDNVFVVDVYVRMLLKLEEKFPLLIHHLHQRSLKQVNQPRVFEKDTFQESAEDRTKRWAVSNGLFVIEVFKNEKYSKEYLNKIVNQWLAEVSPENAKGLEILVKILPKLPNKHLDADILEKLTQISQDKSYPGRLRFLVLDIVEKK